MPRPAPGSMGPHSLPSRARAPPGLCPREPWRPVSGCGGHRQAHTHKQKPAGSFSVPPDSNTPVLEQTETGSSWDSFGSRCGRAPPLLECGLAAAPHVPWQPRSALEGQGMGGCGAPACTSFIPTCPGGCGRRTLGRDGQDPCVEKSSVQQGMQT